MGTAAWGRKTAPEPVSFASLPRLSLLVISAFLVSSPAIAKNMFPVSVPSECAALAVREGVGTVINNRYEAAKAKAKLFRLSDRDPEVALCRQAVKRLQDAARSLDAAPNREAARDKLSSPVAEQTKPNVH
jgi:hypothetical protein